MKNMKKWAVLFLCVLTLGCMTGCGNRDNSVDGADNGTTNTTDTTDKADTTDKKTDTKDKANATDKTNTTDKGDGVMDDAVHDVTDGINDVTDNLTDGDARGDVRSEQTR